MDQPSHAGDVPGIGLPWQSVDRHFGALPDLQLSDIDFRNECFGDDCIQIRDFYYRLTGPDVLSDLEPVSIPFQFVNRNPIAVGLDLEVFERPFDLSYLEFRSSLLALDYSVRCLARLLLPVHPFF